MGKAVPKNVKSRANILMQEKPELFTGDFEKNKRAVDALQLPFSKTIRNLVAGFITRELMKKSEKESGSKRPESQTLKHTAKEAIAA